ncbi:MotA/TolQ/ExbB proton channel family protein [Neptuniibacter halophilus]|uniref:MotA/TolQ/ExbB proton channel family protein n=1 Tax=Neptuniibacter halophilus TaxID=651666 RepID=UPI002573D769|nr:MotA/TolQ/ExbB proton channel family protein [Neptuniibacter halophilus]
MSIVRVRSLACLHTQSVNEVVLNRLSNPHQCFHLWLLFSGLFLFALFIVWELGLLPRVLQQDSTRISVVILILTGAGWLHCAYRSWFLSRQAWMMSVLEHVAEHEQQCRFSAGESFVQDYLRRNRPDDDTSALSAELLAEKLRGAHQVGWFLSSLLIKLGLLGTVVGFILMLSSVSGLQQLDISDIKQLMQQMTQGMGVAMNTTLVGLLASMLLGVQYLLLDRCADQLLAAAVALKLDRTDMPAVEEC